MDSPQRQRRPREQYRPQQPWLQEQFPRWCKQWFVIRDKLSEITETASHKESNKKLPVSAGSFFYVAVTTQVAWIPI